MRVKCLQNPSRTSCVNTLNTHPHNHGGHVLDAIHEAIAVILRAIAYHTIHRG